MGYNSALMICNDAMHEIDKDPAGWWQKASRALAEVSRRGSDGTFGHGSHANYFQAICNHHADQVSIVAIGGNQAKVLGYGSYRDSPEELLKALADQLGYRIVKKSEPKRIVGRQIA